VPVATVEIKGSHSQAGTQARIISQYGCVRIQWDNAALRDILAQLRRERGQYECSISADKGEAIRNALLDEAGQIKAAATQNISKRNGIIPC